MCVSMRQGFEEEMSEIKIHERNGMNTMGNLLGEEL